MGSLIHLSSCFGLSSLGFNTGDQLGPQPWLVSAVGAGNPSVQRTPRLHKNILEYRRGVCMVCFLKGCCWPFPSVFLITSCENFCVSYLLIINHVIEERSHKLLVLVLIVGIQVNNVLSQRAAQENCRKLLRHIART